jgi:hypothetical protein
VDEPYQIDPLVQNTALIYDNYVLPIRGTNDTRPGVYGYNQNAMCMIIKEPQTKEEMEEYNTDGIIDLDSSRSIKELSERADLVRKMEEGIMTNTGDAFYIPYCETDTPAMRGLKEAVNSKAVNITTYRPRFAQPNNDIRMMKKDSITLSKLIEMMNVFDIHGTLILTDKVGCVNKMNREIIIPLNDGGV